MTSAFWFSTYYNFHITSNAPEEPAASAAAAAGHGTGIPRLPLSPSVSLSAPPVPVKYKQMCICTASAVKRKHNEHKYSERDRERGREGKEEGGVAERKAVAVQMPCPSSLRRVESSICPCRPAAGGL